MKKKLFVFFVMSLILLGVIAVLINMAPKQTHENYQVFMEGNTAKSGEENVQATISPSEKTSEGTTEEAVKSDEEIGGAQMQGLIIEVGGQSFQTTLYDNDTARALKERLPMTLSMEELHGNEKFYYLEEGLPTNSENVGSIQTGDLMLFGSDCLVLFFEDFSTSYSYTRIGHVENAQEFAKVLASGTVEVFFRTGE